MATDDELVRLGEKWFKILQENIDAQNPQGVFRSCLIKLAYSYQRLVVLSYGFQHAFGKNNTNENPFLLRVSIVLVSCCRRIDRGELSVCVRPLTLFTP